MQAKAIRKNSFICKTWYKYELCIRSTFIPLKAFIVYESSQESPIRINVRYFLCRCHCDWSFSSIRVNQRDLGISRELQVAITIEVSLLTLKSSTVATLINLEIKGIFGNKRAALGITYNQVIFPRCISSRISRVYNRVYTTVKSDRLAI